MALEFVQFPFIIKIVGVPGIEPGLHAPHACVLPVYYTPKVPSVDFRGHRSRRETRHIVGDLSLYAWGIFRYFFTITCLFFRIHAVQIFTREVVLEPARAGKEAHWRLGCFRSHFVGL